MEFFVFIPIDVGNLPTNLNMVHCIIKMQGWSYD